MELKSNEEKITRALLVSVDTGEYDAQASLDELFELVKSAGADPVLSVTQNLQKIEKGTFVGTGKLAEIAEICESQEIDLLVFDSELSPTQIKNIEAETDVRVIDRTTLILDIFAQRARSKRVNFRLSLHSLNICSQDLRARVSQCQDSAAVSAQEVRAKQNLKLTDDISAEELKA